MIADEANRTGITFRQLLDEIDKRHVDIRVVGDDLRYRPKDALTAELQTEVARYRYELMEREHWITDPRPDLKADTFLWTRVLRLAFTRHGYEVDGVLVMLHAFRCMGAKLQPNKGTLQLAPRYDLSGREAGWADEAQWVADRDQYLMPHATAAASLFRTVAAMDSVA